MALAPELSQSPSTMASRAVNSTSSSSSLNSPSIGISSSSSSNRPSQAVLNLWVPAATLPHVSVRVIRQCVEGMETLVNVMDLAHGRIHQMYLRGYNVLDTLDDDLDVYMQLEEFLSTHMCALFDANAVAYWAQVVYADPAQHQALVNGVREALQRMVVCAQLALDRGRPDSTAFAAAAAISSYKKAGDIPAGTVKLTDSSVDHQEQLLHLSDVYQLQSSVADAAQGEVANLAAVLQQRASASTFASRSSSSSSSSGSPHPAAPRVTSEQHPICQAASSVRSALDAVAAADISMPSTRSIQAALQHAPQRVRLVDAAVQLVTALESALCLVVQDWLSELQQSGT